MRSATVLVALWLALPARGSELDGTQWELKPTGFLSGLRFWRADILTFDEGRFTSERFLPYGFRTEPYKVTRDGDAVEWRGQQRNLFGERIVWVGTRRGSRMTGTMVYIREEGDEDAIRWEAELTRSAESVSRSLEP